MTRTGFAGRVDDEAMGFLGWAFWIVGGLLGLMVVVGGVAWAADYGVEATVVSKTCTPAGGEVALQTKLFSIDHMLREVPLRECQLLQPGNFAVYHIRSGHTTLYEHEGGPCIYDSVAGVACQP